MLADDGSKKLLRVQVAIPATFWLKYMFNFCTIEANTATDRRAEIFLLMAGISS